MTTERLGRGDIARWEAGRGLWTARLAHAAGRIGGLSLLALLVLLLTPQPAWADFDICKDAPKASLPDKSSAGWLAGEPDWKTVPAVAPNPFAKDSTVAIADVYGYNFDWTVYDLGCGNDILRDPQAVAQTATAAMLIQIPSSWVATLSRVQDLVSASPMTWIQNMIAKINSDIGAKLWNVWFPITLVAAGAWIILRSRNAQYAETATALGAVLVVLAVSVFLLNYPTKASAAMDKVAASAVDLASAPFEGTGSSDAVVRNVMYPQWLQGEFGSATSPTAVKYGPDLYWATHYTWSEYKQIRENAKNVKIIDDRKAARFKQLAGEIETNDPTAYTHLTGKDSSSRVGAALMAYPFALAAVIYLLIALLMLAIAKVMLQAFVVAAPIAGLLGAHPRGHTILMSVWDLFTAALVAVAKFALFAGLFGLFLSAVLNSGANPVEQLFWLVVITVIAFALSRPFRTLKTMTPGLNPHRSYLRELTTMIASVAGAKSTPGAGSEKDKKKEHADQGEPVAKEDAPRRAEDEPLPPVPSAPIPRVAASSGGVSHGQAPSAIAAAPAVGDAHAGAWVAARDYRHSVRPLFVDDEEEDAASASSDRVSRSQTASPVLGPPGQVAGPRQLTAGQPHVAGVSARSEGRVQLLAPRSASSAPATSSTADALDQRVSITHGAPVAGGAGSADQVPAETGMLVVASGRVLEAEEGLPVFRSAEEPEVAKLCPAERQLAGDGTETYVIYRSTDDRVP